MHRRMAPTTSKESDTDAARPRAVLLLGPTASGKTPLGDALEARGLWGRACVHFDFGRVLRACALGEGGWDVTRRERGLVASLLEAGALLEDEHFPIAEKLFRVFSAQRRVGSGALMVLNGLPRHVGQAERMERLVRMLAVVHLRCPEETVFARIRRDAGGDRAARDDDDADRVGRKLAVFRERTEPLLAYYRERGVPLIPLEVGPETTAEAMRAELERHAPT